MTEAAVPLAGARVLVTRRPDRSDSLRLTLREAGAEVSFLPLIDFERPAESTALLEALGDLARGRYAWLVFTSATTIDALATAAAAAGTTLAAAVPEATRVAAVGAGTAAALKREGLDAALVPAQQSAAGLVAQWPDGTASAAGTILVPQADIAAATLQEGLQAKGYDVRCIMAYRTVAYPADPRLAIYPAVPDDDVLTPGSAQAELAAGRIDAVVAASPSQVRRLKELRIPLHNCALVAIGPATETEATGCGLPVAVTASEPGPAGVAAAVHAAVHRPGRKKTLGFDRSVTPNEG